MKKLKTITALLLATVMLAACGGSENKKKISIAYANWSEGIAMTNLAKVIFEDQGYEVKLLNADLAPIFASLSRKKADVFMDVWMPVTMADYMQEYGDKLEVIGNIYDNARIGLVVPEYVTINSIEELNAEKDRFSGEIVGIDAGAGIMKATDQALKDYQLDYKLLTSSGPAMTASLKKAIDKNEWIVVTGWTPHWMFDRFKLKILQDPKTIYGAVETIHTVAWKGFSEQDPFAAQLLKNMHLTDEHISSLMTAIEDAQTSETEAARQWMNEHKELVDSWIPKDSTTE
ncbi:MAG TPA: glycine betaine ABC transporter substrate-binding protein [Bacteroides reticulotermitis]|nr:glycine betaine ABC transporter substrate-binding protein [Bacteroides reticulotermitis]